MKRLLLILSIAAFALNGMQQYEFWPDSTFSQEYFEEEDPQGGVRLLCEEILERCNLKNLDNYRCFLRHHLEYVRGGWFMDVYLKEKYTDQIICGVELNRQTKELKQLNYVNNLLEK